MKSGRGGGAVRILFLLSLILVLLVGGAIWLDFLGLVDLKDRLQPITGLFGVRSRSPAPDPDSPMLLDAERLAKERQTLTVTREELDTRKAALDMREAELKQRTEDLDGRERALLEQQKSLIEAVEQYDNKVANLEQTARYLMDMPPEDAVAIMNEYDEKDLVDVLRTSERLSRQAGENSLVAYWLSLMEDRSRAADLQILLVEKPGPDG